MTIPKELTDTLLQLWASLILAVGTWAIGRPITSFGLKNNAQAAANLDAALQKAVTYGLPQSQEMIKEKGWDSIEMKVRHSIWL